MDAKPADRREPLIRLVGWNGQTTTTTGESGPTVTGLAEAGRLASITAIAMVGAAGDPATAGPGDLDPAFGDVGRVVDVGVNGQLWSLDVRDDESIQFAGGGSEYCWYYYDCDVFETLGRLDAFGEPDAAFAPGDLDRTYVYDTALLDDGRVVGTGFTRDTNGRERLAVFRLLPNGALDTTFALTGQTVLTGGSGNDVGSSVLVESDGRVVVAGTRNGRLVVARFLANGSPDPAFGNQGLYQLPSEWLGGYPARLASASGGGYRILSNLAGSTDAPCSVVGVTPSGTADAVFGTNGVRVTPSEHPAQTSCVSFVSLPGGAMLVAGSDGPRAYLVRVLADGTLDAAFDSAPVADRLVGVSALAVGSSGRIFVAGDDGSGLSGATIVRLLANGALDGAFGQGGSTTLEAKTQRVAPVTVHDMQVRGSDALVLAGDTNYGFTPVIARLLGDVGQSGPGVLGMVDYSTFQLEQDGSAVVRVRRTGGAAGNVGVAYRARAVEGGGATEGQDFTAVSGEVTWPDGDASEREITVPIAADSAVEGHEFFEVVLESPTGGAGLGAIGIDVNIAGSSYPHGDFAFLSSQYDGAEGGTTSLWIERKYYGEGPVSVEVRLSGGSAEAGTDFRLADANADNTVVLAWIDGEVGAKAVNVNLLRDSANEPPETIEFELASPGGGALLAAPSQVTLSLRDTTPAPISGDSGGGGNRGGGGIFSGIEALLLAMLAMVRRRWGSARRS